MMTDLLFFEDEVDFVLRASSTKYFMKSDDFCLVDGARSEKAVSFNWELKKNMKPQAPIVLS